MRDGSDEAMVASEYLRSVREKRELGRSVAPVGANKKSLRM
jgi:hypothetical protein